MAPIKYSCDGIVYIRPAIHWAVTRFIMRSSSASREIGGGKLPIMLKFDRLPGSIAAEPPVEFQRDCNISNLNLATSSLLEIWPQDILSLNVYRSPCSSRKQAKCQTYIHSRLICRIIAFPSDKYSPYILLNRPYWMRKRHLTLEMPKTLNTSVCFGKVYNIPSEYA